MADEINYGWQKDFVAKPAKDAVEKDLTESTLVLDMENTLGEVFHWEVPPNDGRTLKTRDTNSASDKNGKVFVLMSLNPFFHPSVVPE